MSSFLETFGRTIGNLRKGIYAPLMEHTAEVELEAKRKEIAEMLARQQAAIELAGQMERQRNVVEDYQQEPLQEGMHGVRPEWNETDALRLFHTYGQAGVDPQKMAEAEKAQMVTDLFAKARTDFADNKYIQAGLALGNAPKAVEFEGGVFFDPNVQGNNILGSTGKYQAEEKKAKNEADEQALRIERIRGLTDPIMQLNATSNKELGEPIEAMVEKDGKSVKTLIRQDSSGNYRHSVVTDSVTGEPLVIPPEAVSESSESPLMRDARVLYQNGVAPDMKTALEMSAYSKTKSPGERFNFLWQTYEKTDPGSGLKPDQWEVARAVFNSWSRGSYGQPFPLDFEKVIHSINDFPQSEKEKLLEEVGKYNQEIAALNPEVAAIGGQPGISPPVVTTQTLPTASTQSSLMATAPTQPLPSSLPTEITAPPLPTEITAPPLPQSDIQPQLQPLTSQAISTAWQAINDGEDPAKVRASLKASGFDMSPQSIERLTIDAVNAGVPQDLFQKYLASIGLAPSG